MNSIIIIGVLFSMAVVVQASPAVQCEGDNFEGLSDRIEVIPCGKTKCKLPKQQNTTVIFKFRPEHKVKTLINSVQAIIGGIALPFVGVDGTSACANVLHAEDNTPAPCPLEPNKEYVYTNAFYMEPIYPELPMIVHWSLDDGKKKVICFEIPAHIVKSKKSKALSL